MSFSQEHRLIYGRLRDNAARRRQARMPAPMPDAQTPLLTPADELTEIRALRRDARANPQSNMKATLKQDIAAVNARSQPMAPIGTPAPQPIAPPQAPAAPAPQTVPQVAPTVQPAPQQSLPKQPAAGQSSKDILEGMVVKGVTDPAQIMQALNYDASGKQIQNWTLEEVQAQLAKGVAPGTTPAPTGQEGSPDPASPAQVPAGPSTQQMAATAGLSAYVSTLPPELQGFGQTLIQTQQAYDQAQQTNAAQYLGSKGIADAAFNQQQNIFSSLSQNYETQKVQSQAILDKVKADQERAVSEGQKAAEQRLEWDTMKSERKLKEVQRKQLDGMVATLALRGGFGSSQGLQDISAANMDFENAIVDLQMEAGVQKTELAAKFTGIYTQVQTDYANSTLGNIKDFNAALERIGTQALASVDARAKAENEALTTFMGTQSALRIEKAKELQNGAKDIQAYLQNERQFKAQQAQLEEDQEWRKMQHESEHEWRKMQHEADQSWKKLTFENSNMQWATEMDFKADEADLRREEKDDAADEKNYQKYFSMRQTESNRIESRMSADPIVKSGEKVVSSFNALESVYKKTVADKKAGKNFSDQALINMFNKLTDPDSVVREAEYARSAEGLNLMDNLRAKYVDKPLKGGVLNDNARDELYAAATTLKTAYTNELNERRQKYYAKISAFNDLAPEDMHLDPEEFGLPAMSSAGSKDDWNSVEERRKSEQGSSNSSSEDSPFSVVGGNGPSGLVGYVKRYGLYQDFHTPVDYFKDGRTTHNGYDIKTPVGTKIPAFVGGKVEVIPDPYPGKMEGNGNHIWLAGDDGNYYLIGHMSKFNVKNGQRVNAGDIIGLSGNTGYSTAPHVHTEVRKGKKNGPWLNPLKKSKMIASHNH